MDALWFIRNEGSPRPSEELHCIQGGQVRVNDVSFSDSDIVY